MLSKPDLASHMFKNVGINKQRNGPQKIWKNNIDQLLSRV